MRLGINGGTVAAGASVDAVIAEVRAAAALGAHSYWTPHVRGHDALTMLAIAGREVPDIELGTAVIPTFPRHPSALAQQALSVQAATGGRLVLGIGLSHQVVIEGMLGLSFAKPLRHMREYLAVLIPLLEGKDANFDGEEYRVHTAVTVQGAARPQVIVAALGPQMLQLTGAVADGTLTWCVGPKTLAAFTIPTLRQAAADAGRGEPRVIATFPICVTDDPDRAVARAAKVFAVYGSLPSYRAMMDREGVSDAGGLAIVGSEAEVTDQLSELAAIGVTDFGAAVIGSGPEEIARTHAVLQTLR